MTAFPENLIQKIQKRKQENALRALTLKRGDVDFSSNDYLGLSRGSSIQEALKTCQNNARSVLNGSTGSRLLTGNHESHVNLERFLSEFHQVEAALIFNSGYDANLGFFSSVPQRNDIVLYDALVHASIRDGMQLSVAKCYKFKHNDLNELQALLLKFEKAEANLYVVTESVFSMDGDSPDLKAMADLTNAFGAHLVVDEAHAVGVFGNHGEGLVQAMGIQHSVFARIVTFGKAIGCHGAAVLGSELLKVYLYNFARSFMYTTALSPHSVAIVESVYAMMAQNNEDSIYQQQRRQLVENINYFKSELRKLDVNNMEYIESDSAIQCVITPGNERVKEVANRLIAKGYDVKPILSPTVPKDYERIRFCLHSFNTFDEISGVLKNFIYK